MVIPLDGSGAIAKVSHGWGTRQSERFTLTMPTMTTMPPQHSAVVVQRPCMPATSVAGQFSVVVGTPKPAFAAWADPLGSPVPGAEAEAEVGVDGPVVGASVVEGGRYW